ncbi:LruC domain-containing protein [Vibrio sp. SM6]|uniref:LruC domain-containing protein n=1 Tax=Vibrio agarilyticus TaxID=2726741 RepID=A0A7X8YFX4_9VIBR|nr:LruC domain-containing protein [Vibrio agarilyticus]NLS11995.1 LruC domain-containing protein [Vibrio agarilyticus]
MMIRRAALLVGCGLSGFVQALTVADLTFESGSEASGYSPLGAPNALYSVSVPENVLNDVYGMVPEGTPVNPAYIAADKLSSIVIDNDLNGASHANATITFLNEGAGYRNALGYFVYDANNPPSDVDDIINHTIVFPNASKANAGELVQGDSLDLDVALLPGQALGFFLIPNGWGGGFNSIGSLGPWNSPFYSLSSLNPESSAENRRHNVAFIDVENEFLVIGFEDLYRPHGDNDFNDLLFTVSVTPFSAIDGVDVEGVLNDNFQPLVPVDSDQLTTSVYPTANGYATLAFEDRWPQMGDYDFNDVVWRYRITEQLTAAQAVKRIDIDYTLQAMGAGYANGYALHLPNVDAANISSLAVKRNGSLVEHTVLQSGSDTVLVISPNLQHDLQALGQIDATCPYYRTQTACLGQQDENALSFTLSVEFDTAVARNLIGTPPYDGFIFAAAGEYHGSFVASPPGMSWQTHLKAFAGTSEMDNTLFGLLDDASNATSHFVTPNNMPWAINLRDEWDHPIENKDISHAYLQFVDWVDSEGESNTGWYMAPEAQSVISNTHSSL